MTKFCKRRFIAMNYFNPFYQESNALQMRQLSSYQESSLNIQPLSQDHLTKMLDIQKMKWAIKLEELKIKLEELRILSKIIDSEPDANKKSHLFLQYMQIRYQSPNLNEPEKVKKTIEKPISPPLIHDKDEVLVSPDDLKQKRIQKTRNKHQKFRITEEIQKEIINLFPSLKMGTKIFRKITPRIKISYVSVMNVLHKHRLIRKVIKS